MPTTNDETPAPRARRALGRGPGAGPVGPGGPGVSEGPAGPEEPVAPDGPAAFEEPSASDEPVVHDVPGQAGGGAASRESGTPDGPSADEAPAEPAVTGVPEVTGAPEATVAGEGPAAAPDAGPSEAPPENGDGRFTLRLDNFEGPFDLLLQLISKHKLDVTEVALSKVTDEFMAHIRAMGPDWDLDQTTEFLVVAATLLDLKAARLLPVAEVEDEADLALLEARDLLFARLLQYRAYKRIADIFSARLADEARCHPRTVGLEPRLAELLPEVVISTGAEGFAKLAVKAMQPKARPQVYVDHIHAPLVSVREQAEVVMGRLREAGECSFQELCADAPDTLTVVARFLALLELYRERVVVLDQDEALGALTVRWTGTEGAEPVVTDEFDQEPGERAAEAERTERAGEERA
ncbi:segregation/condensation protein A [Streptomyces sp. Je 1-4]|uniref:segregation and condensation protein A n=1 Tax=Streptomyces TaxID=1883 RepID=UPI00140F22E0|nr:MULTISPECIES: ScpA family protein [unclassified Streptomyces]QIK09498.1 segregation/condensation protein A [Streptomyces sp. ID38640]UYB43202.1 segregation/condensation protein A [Streptomyces sp. Je 1-4]UZQ39568.1 segregation/condensation protein A [Streptomyces sp. Je 1-4] [Streptomyces sp. Je 1-4 4N24]UZQ46985.1 segregation/condensation protein A [Streptomyces sp. Je 1-4] [Streptomyces sp. Je 1-4 4N24_ara]